MFFFLLRQNVRNRKVERTSEVLHTGARPMQMAMAKLPSIIATGRSDELSYFASKLSDKKSILHVW